MFSDSEGASTSKGSSEGSGERLNDSLSDDEDELLAEEDLEVGVLDFGLWGPDAL